MPALRDGAASRKHLRDEVATSRRVSRGFREVFARFSQGFRKVFARLSLQKYFRERFARAEKNQFLRAAGAPARGAAEPGPPRHAKIGKNHPNQSVRPQKQKKLFFVFLWYLVCGTFFFSLKV